MTGGGCRSPRAMAADLAGIERRIEALEWQIARLRGGARSTSTGVASNVTQATDRIADVLTAALAEVPDRFRGLRGNARAVGDEAARVGQEAARIGNDALRGIAAEVEHRPLMLLAVAVGVGVLVGYAGRRR